MRRMAILRCGKLPSFVTWEIPNLEELFEEDKLLQEGFETEGVQAQPVVWSQPGIDWNQFDLALIRSTWDYLDEKEHFLTVLSQIESSSCQLFNPLEAVRWNIDKRYLFDLKRWGVPILPTLLASDVNPDTVARLFADSRTQMAILKPTIGLGGSHSYRVPIDELTNKLETLRMNQPLQEYLIQPFIEDIVSEGEWSYIYFNRQLSHLLLKKPAPGDYRVQGIYGGTIQPADPSPQDLAQAESVLATLPFDILLFCMPGSIL
jgi:glutathione synthase/RimK-type ligase-like ATP-grasp enzyme